MCGDIKVWPRWGSLAARFVRDDFKHLSQFFVSSFNAALHCFTKQHVVVKKPPSQGGRLVEKSADHILLYARPESFFLS